MKKITFIFTVISFHFINSMEKEKTNNYEQFKLAIINQKNNEIKSLLQPPIDLTSSLNKQGMSCLSLAITENKNKVAPLLVQIMSSQIEKLEKTMLEPFQEAAEKGNPQYFDQIMQLNIPGRLKQSGCNLAFLVACTNLSLQVIDKLINSYAEYIKNPWNPSFERLAIFFPNEHEKIIEIVLSHPKAVKNLEKMINKTNGISYPKEKKLYYELLLKAREIQKNKKS